MTKSKSGHVANWIMVVIAAVVAVVSAFNYLSENFSEIDKRITDLAIRLDSVRTEAEKLELRLDSTASKPVEVASPGTSPSIDRIADICAAGTADDDIILVGQTVDGELSESDMQLEDDGTYIDTWILLICEPGPITIAMTSDDLDSYVALLSVTSASIIAEDDDGGGGRRGRDARVTSDLDRGLYIIVANTATASPILGRLTGRYSLSVQVYSDRRRAT